MTENELRELMQSEEDEHLEFKEAKKGFDFGKLVEYCFAFANKGGGKLVLGITDPMSRSIVGTQAFRNISKTKSKLRERLRGMRVGIEEVTTSDGRVVVLSIPTRPSGVALQTQDGRFLGRDGESVVPLSFSELQEISAEAMQDYSALSHPEASLEDLHPKAITRFRELWRQKSWNAGLIEIKSDSQLLADAELVQDGRVTNAALVLLGTREALGRLMPNAEIIYQYRSSPVPGAEGSRVDFRMGFFLFFEELLDYVRKRTDMQHFRDGFLIEDIPTFNERVVREAVLNAVAHRDYSLQGSVFVTQLSHEMIVTSPGGFPPGITPENIREKQHPRNRRIAEALQKCGLVERAGDGVDIMVRTSIEEGKPRPDYSASDDFQVTLKLRGKVQDPDFVKFLQKAADETGMSFSTEDLLVLESANNEERIPSACSDRAAYLMEQGIIERIGRGRGTRYIPSRAYYDFANKPGIHTRRQGLDRETNKELLLKHIRRQGRDGAQLSELRDVLPALSKYQVQTLLRELRQNGAAVVRGRAKAARWFLPGHIQD